MFVENMKKLCMTISLFSLLVIPKQVSEQRQKALAENQH